MHGHSTVLDGEGSKSPCHKIAVSLPLHLFKTRRTEQDAGTSVYYAINSTKFRTKPMFCTDVNKRYLKVWHMSTAFIGNNRIRNLQNYSTLTKGVGRYNSKARLYSSQTVLSYLYSRARPVCVSSSGTFATCNQQNCSPQKSYFQSLQFIDVACDNLSNGRTWT